MKKLIMLLILISTPCFADYSTGDKFLSDGHSIELVNRIPVYADDDSCLLMMRQGYSIYCKPEVIDWRWEIIIYAYGVSITGWISEDNLLRLKKQSNHGIDGRPELDESK